MLSKEEDGAESVGERDDDWLFFTPPEVLGPVGGDAGESNVFIMACSSADLSQENCPIRGRQGPSLCRVEALCLWMSTEDEK